MILISITYDETTPDSVEAGDYSDSGFVSEREELTFRELVSKMEDHRDASSSGPVASHTWFSSGWDTTNYRTGEERQESIHFHRDNPPHFEKYWIKAADYVARKERERREARRKNYPSNF